MYDSVSSSLHAKSLNNEWIGTMTIKRIKKTIRGNNSLWMLSAIRSFPVPVSPIRRTGNFAFAAFFAVEMTVFIEGDAAMI